MRPVERDTHCFSQLTWRPDLGWMLWWHTMTSQQGKVLEHLEKALRIFLPGGQDIHAIAALQGICE